MPSTANLPSDADAMRIAAVVAPLRQQVVLKIREAIAQGRFSPGERLVERELCDLLGVSRTSLREALRDLESDGIVTSLANRGVVVASVSLRTAREIYEMRALLESLLAERFARLASEAQLASLEQSVKRLARAHAARSGVLQAKSDFYEALMAGADHALAASMLRSIQLRANQLRTMTLSDPERARHSLKEIRARARALRNRDPQAAMEAARVHVQNAGAMALSLLQPPRSAFPSG